MANTERARQGWLLPGWLALQCQKILGARAALAVLGASERAPGARVACWPSPDRATARLSASVEAARGSGRVVIQEPRAGTRGPRAISHVALPVIHCGRSAGAVGVSVAGVAPSELKAVAEALGAGIRELERLLEAPDEGQRLAALVSLAASLLDGEQLREAAHGLSRELVRRLGCERVAVGALGRSGMRVIALSSGLRFTPESDAVRAACAAMQEATDQDALIELPVPRGAPPHGVRDHELLARSSGAGAVCSVPLAARGELVGAVTCEWSKASELDASRRAQLRDATLLCGPILELMARAEAGLIERARARLADWTRRHFGDERGLALAAGAFLAGLLLVLAVAPGSYRISARATLEGRVQRALVAAVPGYLAETHARAGDLVRAGDVLAQLDERDLRLERQKWESEKTQLEKEYREALAGEDRTRVAILRAQVEQAAAQLELAEEQLARTRVVAPFDGVVLAGDLDRSLGSPVEQGDVLFEIAPLDDYRIIVEVDGRDIAGVAPGQHGRLALSALPDRPLPLVVERVTPLSTTEDGRNYFRVEASVDGKLPDLLPGMEGVAKIELGRRRLLWIWTHGLLDWLRLRTWSWLP